jgi:ribose transport system ATP-binding protein
MHEAFANVIFVLTTASTVNDQVNQLDDLAARHIDALVVLPMESDPLTEPTKALKEKGIFITVIDRGLSESGKGKGLLLDKRLAENVALAKGAATGGAWIDFRAERRELDEAVRKYDIRAGNLDERATTLSGGNQQKLLVAKTLATDPDVVVFDEPTRGVDIGAKQQIYGVIAELAAAGKAVVVISSEMQEIVGLSDRVLIMRHGRIAGELAGERITESEIIRVAMGLQEEAIHV